MRKIVLLALVIVVIFAGLVLGPALVEYDGYILVVMEHGTMQLRVFGVFLLLFGLFIVGWLLLWVVKNLVRMLSGSKSWLWSWSSRKRQNAFTGGLLALASGDYEEARKHFSRIEHEDFDGVNLLAAAEVELQLQNPDKAYSLWQQATSFPKAVLAAKLNLIRHCLAQDDTQQARELVDSFEEKHKKLKSVIVVAAQTLAQSGNWRELEEKLPKWKKTLGPDYSVWQQKASQGTFAEIASKEGAMQLKQNWREKPRSVKKDPAQQSAYVQQLLAQQMFNDAQDALLDFQKTGPHPMLLPLMRQLKVKAPGSSIKSLETWIKADDLNAELYSILGELAFNSGDLDLSEKALGRAINLNHDQHDLQLMAAIKEQQNDDKKALQLFKESVQSN